MSENDIKLSSRRLNGLFKHIAFKGEELNPMESCNLLQSLAKLNIQPTISMIEELFNEKHQNYEEFNPPAISFILQSLALLGIKPSSKMLNGIFNETFRKCKKFRSEHISSLLWAMAKLGLKPVPKLRDVLLNEIYRQHQEFNPADVSQILWAFSVFGKIPIEQIHVFKRILTTHRLGLIKNPNFFIQMHQFILSVSQDETKIQDIILPMLESIETQCRSMFIKKARIYEKSSRLQYEVERVIKQMGLIAKHGVILHKIGYSVDIIVIHRNNNIVIEVDGPSHFIRTLSGMYESNGSTIMKHRHIQNNGFKIIQIPFYEWDQLEGQNAKCNYIKKKIELR